MTFQELYTLLVYEILYLGAIAVIVSVVMLCLFGLKDNIEKRKDEKVHIVKGNGWIRYYTNEGWSEE